MQRDGHHLETPGDIDLHSRTYQPLYSMICCWARLPSVVWRPCSVGSWYGWACWAWDGWLACWACLGRAWYGRACRAGGGWPRAWAGALPKVQLPPTDTHPCHRRPGRAHFIFLTTSSTVSPLLQSFHPSSVAGKTSRSRFGAWRPGAAADSSFSLQQVLHDAN